MKQSKREILVDTFGQTFDMNRFKKFITIFFNEPLMLPNHKSVGIEKQFVEHIRFYREIADYVDDKGSHLMIVAVEIKKGSPIERHRSIQRDFVASLLRENSHYKAAIVAFYATEEVDWKFSFVKCQEDYLGRAMGLEMRYAVRQSYLVGPKEPTYAAEHQLLHLFRKDQYNPTVDQIEAGFRAEKLNEEFFKKYKEKYVMLKEYLEGHKVFTAMVDSLSLDIEQFSQKFALKLMGQLLFLYFLQKKGWLGRDYKFWKNGNRRFMRTLFNLCIEGENQNFYKDFLEPLFYEGLNKERESHYYEKLQCIIPFIEGDLFKPLDGYDWRAVTLHIPNNMFFNKKDKKDIGILDLFERYNFTLYEEEPFEQEIAIDPEMLGKIFENLLAVKDRKSKGVFYTPREVVRYMCQESLTHYLSGETNIPQEDLMAFILYGERIQGMVHKEEKTTQRVSFLKDMIVEKAAALDTALKNVRIADPAIGSGAFPLGMLQEIVKLRMKMTAYIVKKDEADTLDKSYGEDLIRKARSPYALKEETIKNSLFAVDIEPSALDISRLRLWLSLVAEQEIGEEKIDTDSLGSLGVNIVVGNSLSDRNFSWSVTFSKVFEEKGGFDIVIGNPPYVAESGNKALFRQLTSTEWGSRYYRGKMDLFYFFFHLAIEIARKKGMIIFITTNYFMTAEGARKLRGDLRERCTIHRMIDFNELKIFKSARGQHNMITLLEKDRNENTLAHCSTTQKTGYAKGRDIQNIISGWNEDTVYVSKKQTELFDGQGNIQLIENDNPILTKMMGQKNFSIGSHEIGNGIDILQECVRDNHVKVIAGLKRGEGIFAVTKEDIEEIHLEGKEKEILKPYYTSRQLVKYGVMGVNEKWILYTDKAICQKIDAYPNIKKHLDRFKPIITSDHKPYGLHRPREEELFKGEKVLSLRMTKIPMFTYVDFDAYVTRAYLVIKLKDNSINLKYLTALLNSKLFYYWFYHKGKRKGHQLQIDKQPLENAPIKIGSSEEQQEMIDAIDHILHIMKVEKQSSHKANRELFDTHENKMNQLVYKLYGLHENEIEVIENFSKVK